MWGDPPPDPPPPAGEPTPPKWLRGRTDILFVELFPGEGSLTKAVAATSTPTFCVPDFAAGGLDLRELANVETVIAQIMEAAQGRTVVLAAAPPCSTMSKVRNRSSRTRVRNRHHISGLPGLPLQTAAKVADANALAEVAAHIALKIVAAGGHASIENPGTSYLWELPTYQSLLQAGWHVCDFNACMFGAPWQKITRLLCSPGWHPLLMRRCRWDSEARRYSCGHSGPHGPNPHTRLGDDVPCHVAAAYATGLCEAWAAEVANLREELRPHTAPGLEASETAPRIHRHATRGQDPDSQREIREKENNSCRAGLRNPQLCTAGGSRPELTATMATVAAFLRRLRSTHPEFQGITRAFGDAPERPPPPTAMVEAARAELLEVLEAIPSAITDQHPHSCWHSGVFKALLLATHDEDLVLADWLLHGAPGGFSQSVPPGPYFPPASDPPGASIDDLLVATRNHPSFEDTFGESISPGRALALDTAKRGFARLFPDRASAEAAYGPMHPAPIGNARRLKADGVHWKNRLILDLRASQANRLVCLLERVVLPREIDHARDLAQLLESIPPKRPANSSLP